METIFIVSLSGHRIDELLADLASIALYSIGVDVHRRLPTQDELGTLMVFNGVEDDSTWCNNVKRAMKTMTTYYMLDDMTTTIPVDADYIVSQFTNGHPKMELIHPVKYFQISLLGSLLSSIPNTGEYEFVYWGHFKYERAEKYLSYIPNAPSTLIIGDKSEWYENGFNLCTYIPYERDMGKLYALISKGKNTVVFGDEFHNGVNIPLRYYEGIACGVNTSISKDLLGTQGIPKILSAKEIGTKLLEVLYMNKSVKVNTQAAHTTQCADTILAERAKVYGSYKGGVDCRADILISLGNKYLETHGKSMPMGLQIMFSDLALKLMRIASDPTHIDSYVDLEGYAKLIKEAQCK